MLPSQKKACQKYIENAESWSVRTNDVHKKEILKKAKEKYDLRTIFFEFLEKKINEDEADFI